MHGTKFEHYSNNISYYNVRDNVLFLPKITAHVPNEEKIFFFFGLHNCILLKNCRQRAYATFGVLWTPMFYVIDASIH